MKQKSKHGKPALKSFVFQNFKGIKQLSVEGLPEDAPWIFMTGENGYGKTCVLQALASSLSGIEEHMFELVRSQPEIQLSAQLHNDSQEYGFNASDGTFFKDNRKNYSNLACYGSARLDTYSESSSMAEGITLSLYDSRTLLENIELQLSRWYFKKEDRQFKEKYLRVSDIMKDLLQIKAITVTKDDKVLYTEKDPDGALYDPLPAKSLAAGYRNIIAMVGDMILRLFRTQPKIYDPSQLKGIVIIDELDLHLHPKWQKRLPGLLSQIFPGIQFVASTHSPIPLLGAPEGSVFLRIDRCKEEGITVERLTQIEKLIKDLLPNAILSSPVFGLQDIFPASHHGGGRIRTEDTYDEIVINDKLAERLKQYKGSPLEDDLLQSLKAKKEPDENE